MQLTYAKAIYDDKEINAVVRSLKSGYLSGGPETKAFEKEFAKFMGVKHALSVNSGSVADLVALQSLGLKKGDEVITNAGCAFPTTISSMLYLGLVPVFVDNKGLCIDPDLIEKAISSKTKAIMFAQTLGFTPNMCKFMEIVKKYNLKLIEDICDAVGTTYNDQKVGTFGDVSTVSFYPAHHMTTGEGGMVLTNSDTVYREALMTRDWGRDCVCGSLQPCANRYSNPPFDHRYYYSRIGLNFKISEMQAAFGREQLKRLPGFIQKRKDNFKFLATLLGESYNIEISPFAYPLFSKHKEADMKALNEAGIDTRTMFAGNITKHPAFAKIKCRIVGDLINSDRILQEGYFVGIAPHLTEKNLLYIAREIQKCRLV
jgi:CDP-6-deoxy-D-xylo-4-hexulose-3-dehydrase